MNAKQKEEIKNYLNELFVNIITDNQDRNEFINNIICDVIEDIETCADWNDYDSDEVNISDVNIALSRCLLKISSIGI